MEPLLKLESIKRSFGAIDALRSVDFDVMPGEVMGLVGENGAGKSTLVKIISGFDSGYQGRYWFKGETVKFSNAARAEHAGIAIAQQELSLIPTMSVAENVFLVGHNVPAVATKRSLVKRTRTYLEEVGLDAIDPAIPVDRLSVGERHLVEVARLIAHDPSVLILDEPTAALGESDSIRILDMVTRLAERGKSIIYVSHRLDEIFKVTNRITVLRDGESQPPRVTSELDVHELVSLMLGREMDNMFPVRALQGSNEVLMRVKNLWPDGLLDPVSFDVRAGEILGLAGQLGSGSGEILGAMAGAHQCRGGTLEFDGKEFLPTSPRDAIARGIGYCSEDRKHDGLFLGRPIRENLSAPALSSFGTLGMLSRSRENRLTRDIAETFTVDISRMTAEVGLLSGGNQQKVALGKWLSIEPRIILVNEPTRGVDVGARSEIYKKLRELADSGAAIVMASTDIQEIVNLPDRILTFFRGMHIGEIPLEDVTPAGVLKQITDPFNETNL